MTSDRRKVWVVYGMHRSATSSVAVSLHEHGIDMGDKLLGPHSSNPWGHGEDQPVVNLNDKLLAKCGATWDDPPTDTGPMFDNEGLGLVLDYCVQRNLAADRWGMKDPRFTFTLPVWYHVLAFELELDVILCPVWRHPREIERSLIRRDGMNETQARALVRKYHDAMEVLPRNLYGTGVRT